ncbi:hypothetical protein BpHYR1_002657 [Brachionus plicatilis]|uniref:Uncharacterized protein n=1 Tax=Brachionus plicatilis TaxID=10195 RepID=A0A3M7RMH6_BRAPC|nr:hypothetical protein BpHYR1_002657 [Brachionus plicatilis]
MNGFTLQTLYRFIYYLFSLFKTASKPYRTMYVLNGKIDKYLIDLVFSRKILCYGNSQISSQVQCRNEKIHVAVIITTWFVKVINLVDAEIIPSLADKIR